MHEPSVDVEYFDMRICVRHLRHADGDPFAFRYDITSPKWGEIRSDACYECGETFDEFVENCRRIVDAVILDPYAWLSDDWFDECERCGGNGSVEDIQGDIVDCGPCRGRGKLLQN